MWNISHLVSKGDYMYAVVKDHPNATIHGYVLHHRVVMENKLGRLLTNCEVVHHKDGNKKNNSIDNLELMSEWDHQRLHVSTGRSVTTLLCFYCGKSFTRFTNQLKGRGFCSRSCSGKAGRIKP